MYVFFADSPCPLFSKPSVVLVKALDLQMPAQTENFM